MQLEELQHQWQRLDEKLDRTLKLDGELLRLAVTQASRRRVNRLAIWPALDIAFCLGILLLTGFFLSRHWNTWSLVSPASIVMIAAIMLLLDSIRQLDRVSKIDWSGMVVDIQSSLSRLRIAKIRQFKWIILLSPLVGFCGLIVGLQWLLDRLPGPHFILDKFNPWWVASNYTFGVLFILFGHAVIRFLLKRYRYRGWWQRVLDGISGSSMTKARAELERWTSLDYEGLNDPD
jgi:hypothetical protein